MTTVLRRPGRLSTMHLRCKMLHCPGCRGWHIAQRVAHFKVNARLRTTYAHLVDQDDWQRVRKQTQRKRVEWAKFDRRGALLTVLSSEPLDGLDPQPIPIEQLELWVTRHYEALPRGGAVVFSEAWRLSNGVQHKSEWRLVGFTPLSPEEVLERARQRGWQVKDDGTMTPPTEEAEDAFLVEIGVRRPDYHARRWWADAA
jgi:hypothetical protein